MAIAVRRVVLAMAIALLATPFPSEAQQPAKTSRVGLLSPFSPSETRVWHEAFRQRLRELGWVEGQTVAFEYRFAEGRLDRLTAHAAELVHLKVDLIFVDTTSPALAAKKATRTIPIVMAAASEVVASGLVASLAQPGGNVTGLDQIAPGLVGKRLEMLREVVPRLSAVAVLWNPQNRTSTHNWSELQAPARQLGVALRALEVRSADDLDRTLNGPIRPDAGAVVVLPDPIFVGNLKRIADFAARHRLPSIAHLREFAEAGGLLTYGPDRADLFRRAADYVDKILRGARPADLPVQRPTKLELVVNLKAAKALGLALSPSLLLRANHVIE